MIIIQMARLLPRNRSGVRATRTFAGKEERIFPPCLRVADVFASEKSHAPVIIPRAIFRSFHGVRRCYIRVSAKNREFDSDD